MTNCANRFDELMHEQETIRQEDITALQKLPERERIERYNSLKADEQHLQNEFRRECPEFLTDGEIDRVRGEIRLARLLIAASFYQEESIPTVMAEDFVDTELQAVVDFERYKQFDALSIEQIEERIFRMDGEVYELVTQYTSTQIADMEAVLEDPEVHQDVMERLLDRYEKRREKVRQGFFRYVEAHGLEHMVESIEEAVRAVADAAEEREQIHERRQASLNELSASLDDGLNTRTETLESEFAELEAKLASETADRSEVEATLKRIQNHDSELSESQAAALSEIDEKIDHSREFEARLEANISTLESAHEATKEADRETVSEEARELVANELRNLREEREQLEHEREQLEREREQIETARERLDGKQESLESRVENIEQSVGGEESGLDGESVVTTGMARLLELDYLGRFDISMGDAKVIETGNDQFHVPDSYWDDRSERRSERMRLVDLAEDGADVNQYPANRSSRYEISQSRYLGLSAETEMVIEARVHSHLEAFTANGFDGKPADLDDLLSVVNEAVHEAETREYTYLLGIASPTGWTDQVIDQLTDKDSSHTRFSRHLSVCLIDLQEGTVVYDESDPVIAENAALFEPPIDTERVKECVGTVRDEYADDLVTETVLAPDVVTDHGYQKHIVKRAFDRLEADGVGEQLYIDDLGLTLDLEA